MPISPRLIKAGIVQVDPRTLAPRPGGIVALQYNPDTVTRSLQAAAVESDGQDRSQVLRLKGPPVETIRLEAEIDAADQLERNNATAGRLGIQPQLAALELLVYPTSQQVDNVRRLAAGGTLEVLPMESPLALFVWSKSRVTPVRITEFSITEEAFDTELNPIRARVSLTLRVLNANDLGIEHRGSELFARYHREKESLAANAPRSELTNLGISSVQ